MKKKLLALSCAVILSFTLTSCQLKDMVNGNSKNNTEDSTDTQAATTDKVTPETTTDTTSNSTTNDISSETASNTTENKESSVNAVENKESSINTDSDSTSEVSSNSVNKNCRVFYFNGNELKTYYVDTTVTVIDNAFVTALTSKLHESPDSDNNYLVLPTEVGVSSASLDADTGVLKVVFNEDFTKTMELGTSTESGLISALVNTYGFNYGVDKVAIYFGDELYTGLKGELPEGYYTVNYSDTTKLN